MVTNTNIEQIAQSLERQELENGAAAMPVQAENYTKLLAIYLCSNDICSAKFLWKRIPQATKSSHAELEKVWTVGQNMWQRNFPGIYKALDETWSPELTEIMQSIRDRVRKRAINLVATAYSSVSLSTLSEFVGMSSEETVDHAKTLGWQVENGTTVWVTPVKPEAPPKQHVSCEEQLAKLTDFVSFLEN